MTFVWKTYLVKVSGNLSISLEKLFLLWNERKNFNHNFFWLKILLFAGQVSYICLSVIFLWHKLNHTIHNSNQETQNDTKWPDFMPYKYFEACGIQLKVNYIMKHRLGPLCDGPEVKTSSPVAELTRGTNPAAF